MKNKIYKAYKFRIYPTKIQVDFLNKQFGAVRFIYNYFLNQRDTQFKETGKSDNYYAQTKTLKLMKGQEEFKWLKEINSQTCQQALQCLKPQQSYWPRLAVLGPHLEPEVSASQMRETH